MTETPPAVPLAGLGLGDAMALGPRPAPDHAVAGLAVDSRAATPGCLFVALRGERAHGAAHAPQALKAGARAILTDLDGALRVRAALGGWPVPCLVVADPRRRLAEIAARFFGRQPRVVVAVTGTNGKTSVTRFLQQIWSATGRPSAAFGTTGLIARGLPGGALDEGGNLTTPEPIALHRLLGRLEALGVERAAMEASSHGLAQHRLDGVKLAAVGFTNLTRDHLDYHADLDAYAAAKLRLLAELAPIGAAAALNADDPIYAVAAAVAVARKLRVLPVGRAAGDHGVRLVAQDPRIGGQTLRIAWAGATRLVELPLVGAFQASNALMAAALAIGSGTEPDAAFAALGVLEGAPGRMERVARRANGAGVYVDYAHTPDAIATAIAAIRPHAPGRVHVVIGAGGDRDAGKRPLMGRAAAAADIVIVTDDNPRSEEPAAIRRAVLAGLTGREGVSEIADRAEAILRAVDGLGPGDALIVAGKGHESGQIVGDRVLPFDDREQARAAVAALDGADAEPDATAG